MASNVGVLTTGTGISDYNVFHGEGTLIRTRLSIERLQCMNSATTKAMTALSRASAIVEESIMNVRTVAAYNGQEVMVNRCAKELAVAQRYGVRSYAWGGFWDGIFFLAMYFEMGIGC